MEFEPIVVQADEWSDATRWADAFLAGFKSPQTRRSYRRDLDCWLVSCASTAPLPRPASDAYRDLPSRTRGAAPSAGERDVVPTHRNAQLLVRWLEDEDLTVGNPAARMRRPQRYARPQPWLNRNELTDLLAVAEDEGGDPYALACLLALNGLRVSEACNANVTDLVGSRYQPTLQIVGKGDKPAEVVLNPRTQQALDQLVDGRTGGPLLRNE